MLANYRGVSSGKLLSSKTRTFRTCDLDSTRIGALDSRTYRRVSDGTAVTPTGDRCTGHLAAVTGTLNGGVGNRPIGCGICVTGSIGTFTVTGNYVHICDKLVSVVASGRIRTIVNRRVKRITLNRIGGKVRITLNAGTIQMTTTSTNKVINDLSRSRLNSLNRGLIGSRFSRHRRTRTSSCSCSLLHRHNVDPTNLTADFRGLTGLRRNHRDSVFSSRPTSTRHTRRVHSHVDTSKIGWIERASLRRGYESMAPRSPVEMIVSLCLTGQLRRPIKCVPCRNLWSDYGRITWYTTPPPPSGFSRSR